VIGDPGAQYADLEDRYECSLHTLERCIEFSQSTELTPLVAQTLSHFIPATREGRSAYTDGFVWVAASPDGPGLAFYVEAAPSNKAVAWSSIRSWLKTLLPDDAQARQTLDTLESCSIPASVGLEGSSTGNLRAKVYFRLKQSIPLQQLGIDLLAGHDIAEFLHTAMGDFGVDRDGLVFSIGFRVATGAMVDAKVDLCGHCIRHNTSQWINTVTRLTDRFQLAALPVSEALNECSCAVAFIGFAVDTKGGRRLNLYLNHGRQLDAPSLTELQAAVTDGVRYLCTTQQEDGSWTDYQLPVGVSDQWITAFVGLALARVGNSTGNSEASIAAAQAASWLHNHRTYSAGWGYNSITGPDADSTAIAICLMKELDWPVDPADQAFLRDRWQPAAGFATYHGPDAWGTAHWDVTPGGYLALSEDDQTELRDEFISALHANSTPEGLWRTYWWRHPYYSSFTTMEALNQLQIANPDCDSTYDSGSFEIDSAFDLACVVGIDLLRSVPDPQTAAARRFLVNWQFDDGRWPGYPNLRVTDDTCYEPWLEPVGEYYTDHAATITTAMVLRVLTLMLTHTTNRPPMAAAYCRS
jgi:hypothetical protein